ncbi:unnamed protein product [Brugia pahangi]|uniref:MACPF domain-containing protein n=1 Tax=Brugia pahangi TaxID=6280 RepID=A0A0N4T3N1_BRUPA|nr:unnamed protein product [Brugia pahangi]
MHYTGGIIDNTYLSYSHVLTVYPCDTAMSLGDHVECCIDIKLYQGCIRMGNCREEEDELVIRKNFFLGIGFGSNEAKSAKITGKLDTTNFEGKQEEWNARLIAEQLRSLADNFEVKFQKVYKDRGKSSASLFSSFTKYVINIPIGRVAGIV